MVRTLRLAGLEVVGVEADESGMKTASLADVDATLAYVTPSHQFPLGGILSAERRVELVSWARSRDAWIAEDDYDAEFRYVGPPAAPLWTLESERTIYVGTFSKTLFPALRIGYAIVPEALEREWREERVHADVQNPPFEQLALARLLAHRSVDRHVARMKRLYGRRRETLLSALEEYFGMGGGQGCPQVLGDASGLHLAVRFPGFRFDRELIRKARADGIRLVSVARHSLSPASWEDTLLLGYGHLDEQELHRGIARIAGFLARERPDLFRDAAPTPYSSR
jgi:GntR family transcriptional regulator/MocR family aminotransferase